MFLDPSPSPFDLRFRLFRTDVRVHPWFWLVAVFLGWNFVDGAVADRLISPPQRFLYLLLWVACVLVSILLHELGHVFMGRCFGADGHIVLYSFGGLAIGSNNVRHGWQHIAVSAAGPVSQLIFWGLLTLWWRWLTRNEVVSGLPPTIYYMAEQLGAARLHLHLPAPAYFALEWLLWINFAWAVLNLIPIWPLDGGQIARQVFGWFSRDRGVPASLILSMVVAATLAANEFMQRQQHHGFLPGWMSLGGSLYMAIFFAIFAINNYFEWQALRYQHREIWEEERW